MREAQLIPAPVFHPGKCFFCGSIDGRHVDTMVDIVGDGRIYICERICLPRFARLAGYLAPEDVGRLRESLEKAHSMIGMLQSELEHERDHKVVSMSDMVSLVERRHTREAPTIEKGQPLVKVEDALSMQSRQDATEVVEAPYGRKADGSPKAGPGGRPPRVAA